MMHDDGLLHCFVACSLRFLLLTTIVLVTMILRCMIVNTVELVDRIEMRKTDCFGRTTLVLHVPSSS